MRNQKQPEQKQKQESNQLELGFEPKGETRENASWRARSWSRPVNLAWTLIVAVMSCNVSSRRLKILERLRRWDGSEKKKPQIHQKDLEA